MTVTPSFFRVLRVQPLRGQLFTDEQGELGPGEGRRSHLRFLAAHVRRQRRRDRPGPSVGRRAVQDRRRVAAGFRLPQPRRFSCIRPAAFTAREKSDDSRHSNNWQQFGRLKPGATVEQAQSQLDAINAANFERFPAWREILTNARFGTDVVDFQAESRRRTALDADDVVGRRDLRAADRLRERRRISCWCARRRASASWRRVTRWGRPSGGWPGSRSPNRCCSRSSAAWPASGSAGGRCGPRRSSVSIGCPSGVALSPRRARRRLHAAAGGPRRHRRRADPRDRDAPRQPGAGDSRRRTLRHARPRRARCCAACS